MKRASGSRLKPGKRPVPQAGINPFESFALGGSEGSGGRAPPVLLATVEQCTLEAVDAVEEIGVNEQTQRMVLRSKKCSVVAETSLLPMRAGTGETSLQPSTEFPAPRQNSARISECQAALLSAAEKLTNDLKVLHFKDPVSCVYNPLEYAWEPFRTYIMTYGGRPGVVLLLGMNPGPFGMVQTGVPFGDVTMCNNYLKISGTVTAPPTVHPQRPVVGFDCKRTEVSGTRLWGWARRRYPDPHAFFDKFFIHNYCPLAFMETSGKNRTPDRLSPAERAALLGACDDGLRRVFELLQPSMIVGIGKYSAERARKCAHVDMRVADVLHPSPANPSANKAWESIFESQLEALGVAL